MGRSMPNSVGKFRFWRTLVLQLVAITILVSAEPARVGSQPPDIPKAKTWITNGRVLSVATEDGVTYIGGDFTHVGPYTANGVPISEATGRVRPAFLKVNGAISAVVPDGTGGWYIGGYFTNVGGEERNRIAHLLSDNSLDMSWRPNVNGPVWALAVSGGTVYAGGDFTSIDEQVRNNIAALDAVTGEATSWDPNADYGVWALAVSGGKVYTGGGRGIAALDAVTGEATSWNTNTDGTVLALAVSGGIVYAGGIFTSIDGQVRNYIAALDALTGEATAWNPNAEGLYPYVRALAASGGTVYVGGDFTGIGGQTRNFIAALDALTGEATGWDPNAEGEHASVGSLAVSNGIIYAGGLFTRIGGQNRNNIAAIDAATGQATAWNPSANAEVYALAVSGGTVYAGGGFTNIGGQERNRIAALDAVTGEAASWNPSAEGTIYALAVSSEPVYAGGAFTSIGGQTKNCIAALDAVTGEATSWDPNANYGVLALAVSGGTVYAGGWFTSIGGQVRNNIAALDAVTGEATSWDPNANGAVRALAVSGGTVYAGGSFYNISGQERRYIAALDATTGEVTAWDPRSGGDVWSLAVNHGIVYVGGDFGGIGGEERRCIGAVDATTGEVIGWNPRSNLCSVRGLAVSGGAVYVGGCFTGMGELPQSCFAQFGVYPIISTPIRIEFGTLTAGSTSPPKTLTVTNVVECDLLIDSILLTGPNSEDFILQRDLCSGTTLAPSGNCTVEVAFAPGFNGLESAYVTISSNTPKAWTLDVPVTGTGEMPDISVIPSSLDFGTVPERASITSPVSISNMGTSDLLVGTITLTGTDALEFSLQDDSCSGHTVAPSSNCSVEVVFSPLSAGLKSVTLNIPSNDPDTPAFGVSVIGTGVIYQKVTLVSPNGGEAMPSGSTYIVIWGAPPQAVEFKLQYSMDDGATWKKIESNLSGMTHEWKVPRPQKNKTACLVRVTGYKASGVKVGSDKSDDPFRIEVVSITAPIEDEIVSKGRVAYPLTLTMSAAISENVRNATVFYTLGNSGIWKKAAGTVMNPLTGFSWDVPSPAKPRNARLKVVFRDGLGNKVATAMSEVFRIE